MSESKPRRSASSYTEEEIRAMTPGGRVDLCWLMSLEAFGYTPETVPPMRKDVVRVTRLGDPDPYDR